MSGFKKASRERTKARIVVYGGPKAGKSYQGLIIATTIAGKSGRVAAIDTENRSLSLYAGRDGMEFDVVEMGGGKNPDYSPETYMKHMDDAVSAGYDVLYIDSGTHAWAGPNGLLERADRFDDWKKLTPIQNAFLAAIQHCPIHLVMTLRAKIEYIVEEKENRFGKMSATPRKLGTAPIQRKEFEYEFTVACRIDAEHNLNVEGTRISALDGAVFPPTAIREFAEAVREFHASGAEPTAMAAYIPHTEPAPTKPAPVAKKAPPPPPLKRGPLPPMYPKIWAYEGGMYQGAPMAQCGIPPVTKFIEQCEGKIALIREDKNVEFDALGLEPVDPDIKKTWDGTHRYLTQARGVLADLEHAAGPPQSPADEPPTIPAVTKPTDTATAPE